MPPNNYNLVPADSIELLAPGEVEEEAHHTKRNRHVRSNSTTSFVHFRAPQQQIIEVDTTGDNKLASQVKYEIKLKFKKKKNLAKIESDFIFFKLKKTGSSVIIHLRHRFNCSWMDDGYIPSKTREKAFFFLLCIY